MLPEMFTAMATSKLEELKKDPAKHQEMVQMMVTMFDLSTQLLKDSPEFREGFGKVHAEFFRHPECQETIAAIKAAAHGTGGHNH